MDAHVVMDPNGGTTWGHAKTSQSTSAAPSSYGGVHDPEGQETTPTDVFASAASMQQIRTATWSATPTPVQREQPMPAPAQRVHPTILGQMFAPIRACFSGNCERGSGGGKGGNSRSRGAGKGGRSAPTHAAAQPHPLSTSERSTGSSSTQFGSHASVSSCPMQPSCSNPQQHPMAFSAHPFSPPPMTMFHGHGLPPPQPPPPPPRQLPSSQLPSAQLTPTESLFRMGFHPDDVGRALAMTRGDVVRALEVLRAVHGGPRLGTEPGPRLGMAHSIPYGGEAPVYARGRPEHAIPPGAPPRAPPRAPMGAPPGMGAPPSPPGAPPAAPPGQRQLAMSQDPSWIEKAQKWTGPEPFRVPGKKKRSAPRVKRETLALLAEMERLTAENAGGAEDNEGESTVNLDVLRLDETESREGGASAPNACTGGEQYGANWSMREGGASAPNACTGGEQHGANWAMSAAPLAAASPLNPYPAAPSSSS